MNHDRDFGLLISLLLPGFIVLLGMAHHSAMIQTWIGTSVPDAPSLGGFLYLTVAAFFAGLVVSTFRWLLIDAIHSHTGLKQPQWNFAKLADRQEAFAMLIDAHYRYYQFYANSMVALVIFAICRWSVIGFSGWELAVGIVMEILFFSGSRDTLRKYYQRVDALLASAAG